MKVRIFGSDLFESKWVPRPRGWIAHTFLCDGQVAVHAAWLDQGYAHAVVYDHKAVARPSVLDWLQEHAAGSHIVHPSGAVLFTNVEIAQAFDDEFGGK